MEPWPHQHLGSTPSPGGCRYPWKGESKTGALLRGCVAFCMPVCLRRRRRMMVHWSAAATAHRLIATAADQTNITHARWLPAPPATTPQWGPMGARISGCCCAWWTYGKLGRSSLAPMHLAAIASIVGCSIARSVQMIRYRCGSRVHILVPCHFPHLTPTPLRRPGYPLHAPMPSCRPQDPRPAPHPDSACHKPPRDGSTMCTQASRPGCSSCACVRV